MSEEDRCQNGNPDCDFGNEHEQALVGEIMRVIGSYNKTEDIEVCPLCLRDTMLAVAALLHIEAARIDLESGKRPARRAKIHGDDFVKAARKAHETVSLAKAALVSSRSRN